MKSEIEVLQEAAKSVITEAERLGCKDEIVRYFISMFNQVYPHEVREKMSQLYEEEDNK